MLEDQSEDLRGVSVVNDAPIYHTNGIPVTYAASDDQEALFSLFCHAPLELLAATSFTHKGVFAIEAHVVEACVFLLLFFDPFQGTS